MEFNLLSNFRKVKHEGRTVYYLSFHPHDPTIAARISACLSDISCWMKDHHIQLKLAKTELLVVSTNPVRHINHKGLDTPSRLQITNGDKSRRCCRLSLAASDQKAACKHTAQTTADGKLTRAFCACVRGINCLYQQLSIVYIRHSKGETETKIYKKNADIRNVNKSSLAYHFEYQ